MINSGAFPNVTFNNPATPGPDCSASCSVASPIIAAAGNHGERRDGEHARGGRVEEIEDERQGDEAGQVVDGPHARTLERDGDRARSRGRRASVSARSSVCVSRC